MHISKPGTKLSPAKDWHATDLAARYEAFRARFAGLRPAPGDDTLSAQVRLVHEWRRFPFLDPRLPAQLLPDNWSGAKAADLFHSRHADWHPAAQRHWERLIADAGAS